MKKHQYKKLPVTMKMRMQFNVMPSRSSLNVMSLSNLHNEYVRVATIADLFCQSFKLCQLQVISKTAKLQ